MPSNGDRITQPVVVGGFDPVEAAPLSQAAGVVTPQSFQSSVVPGGVSAIPLLIPPIPMALDLTPPDGWNYLPKGAKITENSKRAFITWTDYAGNNRWATTIDKDVLADLVIAKAKNDEHGHTIILSMSGGRIIDVYHEKITK